MRMARQTAQPSLLSKRRPHTAPTPSLPSPATPSRRSPPLKWRAEEEIYPRDYNGLPAAWGDAA